MHHKRKGRHGSALWVFVSISILLPEFCSAEGFRIYGLSADGQMRGEALVASARDASAVWYNPAALKPGRLDVSANLSNMFLFSGYTDLLGREEKSRKKHFTPAGLYYASNLGTERFALGVGFNTPFGLGTEYSDTSSFRYITTGGELTVFNINPTAAYRPNDVFSVGVGLDYYYSTVKLTQQYPWFAVGTVDLTRPDGTATVEGAGDGFGFNAGVLVRPAPEHSVGLTYRSQVVVKYSGKDAVVTNIPAVYQGLFPAGSGSAYHTRAASSIRFPDMIGFGYAFQPSQDWTWEVGGQWTNWDDVRSVDVTLAQPVALFPNTSTALNWKNSWVIRTGVERRWEQFSLAGGYFYDASPTVESTYTPLIPDGDHHVVSLGCKYRLDRWTFSLPLVGIFQTGKDGVNSSAVDATGTQNTDGKYALVGFQLGLGVNYQY